jgi:hypothetical protein
MHVVCMCCGDNLAEEFKTFLYLYFVLYILCICACKARLIAKQSTPHLFIYYCINIEKF